MSDVNKRLVDEVRKGSETSTARLAGVEAAVLAGHFNVAKVLRAAAHSWRVTAMNAARSIVGERDLIAILGRDPDLSVLRGGATVDAASTETAKEAVLRRIDVVHARTDEILDRASASLEKNGEIFEEDVALFLYGCHRCGYVVEGGEPVSCPLCGAVRLELEAFGPFYIDTLDHLGHRSPQEVVELLPSVPNRLAELLAGIEKSMLEEKPTKREWSVAEIVGHLIEVDRRFVTIVATIVNADGIPEIENRIVPWMLHEGKGYDRLPVSELIDSFAEARKITCALVSGLRPEQWLLEASLPWNRVSVLEFGIWLANHDIGHLAQIRRRIG